MSYFLYNSFSYLKGSATKMSNYSKSDDWCEIVDGLYWRFIDDNRELFNKNPRMGMMVKLLDKMDDSKKEKLFKSVQKFEEKILN